MNRAVKMTLDDFEKPYEKPSKKIFFFLFRTPFHRSPPIKNSMRRCYSGMPRVPASSRHRSQQAEQSNQQPQIKQPILYHPTKQTKSWQGLFNYQ